MKIQKLMESSGVKFGTSGARGLAEEITDQVAYAYTKAFLRHLQKTNQIGQSQTEVALAGDLRPSTDRIMIAVAQAITDLEYIPVNMGKIPSPAILYYGLEMVLPTIMVTGSHIPEERNGIKFSTPNGEISKEDEKGIKSQRIKIPSGTFNKEGSFSKSREVLPVSKDAERMYINRYLEAFPPDSLKDKRIGIYEQSCVGRDILTEIYSRLGADVVKLARSETFISVDTEAIEPRDYKLALEWSKAHRTNDKPLDAILSTDGDSDRPLVSDEFGKWIRGDILGILVARYLDADAVVKPISCNTAVRRCEFFKSVTDSKIGSPYVIAAMQEINKKEDGIIVGYEANGGFLLNSDVAIDGKVLRALPSRDAVLVHIASLALSKRENKSISELVAGLPQRSTASNRLKEFPSERSQKILTMMEGWKDDHLHEKGQFSTVFDMGPVSNVNTLDGIRITFDTDEIIHLRASGNAPEFRCYTEADNEERAEELLDCALNRMEQWRQLSNFDEL